MGEIADALRRSGAGTAFERESQPAHRRASGSQPLPSPTRRPREAGSPQALRPTEPAILREDAVAFEACRQLALSLRSNLERHGARTAAVVSALRDEGKTTTSCNLALALASLDSSRSIALVGLDLRRPRIAKALGIDVSVGVEQVLTGTASLDDARVVLAEPPLSVYAAVTPQRAAHEILTGRHLSGFIAALEQRHDNVIVDTPPVLLVPDAQLILEHVPLCVPIARAGRTRVRSFRDMLDALHQRQLLGTLLNGTRGRSHYYHTYDYIDDEHRQDPRPRKGTA